MCGNRAETSRPQTDKGLFLKLCLSISSWSTVRPADSAVQITHDLHLVRGIKHKSGATVQCICPKMHAFVMTSLKLTRLDERASF